MKILELFLILWVRIFVRMKWLCRSPLLLLCDSGVFLMEMIWHFVLLEPQLWVPRCDWECRRNPLPEEVEASSDPARGDSFILLSSLPLCPVGFQYWFFFFFQLFFPPRHLLIQVQGDFKRKPKYNMNFKVWVVAKPHDQKLRSVKMLGRNVQPESESYWQWWEIYKLGTDKHWSSDTSSL